MRAGFIVSGVLGVGTVLVFAAAALVAMLFPNGTLVGAGWNGGWAKDGWGGAVMVPAPAPMIMPADISPVVDDATLLPDGSEK